MPLDAGLIATGVSALVVGGELIFLWRHARMQESSILRDEELAWRGLSREWDLSLVVAYGPNAPAARVDRQDLTVFISALRRRRDAEIEWLRRYQSPDTNGESAEFDLYDEAEGPEKEELEAIAGLHPYRQAVQAIVLHLAHLAALVLRGDLSSAKVYSAVGVPLVIHRDGVRKLLRLSSSAAGDCPAGFVEEAELWKRLPLDEVNERLGWGDFLVSAPGTADRVQVLLDLLAAEAASVGDAQDPLGSDFADEDPELLVARLIRVGVTIRRRRRKFVRLLLRGHEAARPVSERSGGLRGWVGRTALTRRARRRASTLEVDERFPPPAHEVIDERQRLVDGGSTC